MISQLSTPSNLDAQDAAPADAAQPVAGTGRSTTPTPTSDSRGAKVSTADQTADLLGNLHSISQRSLANSAKTSTGATNSGADGAQSVKANAGNPQADLRESLAYTDESGPSSPTPQTAATNAQTAKLIDPAGSGASQYDMSAKQIGNIISQQYPAAASGSGFSLSGLKTAASDSKASPDLKRAANALFARPDMVASLDAGDPSLGTAAGSGQISQKNLNDFTNTGDDHGSHISSTIGDASEGQGGCEFLSALDATTHNPSDPTDQSRSKQLASSIRPVLNSDAQSDQDYHYDVTFAGDPGTTYHVSQNDLSSGTGFSTGDKDTQILEQAANQYNEKKHGTSLLNGGYSDQMQHLLDNGEHGVVAGANKAGQTITPAVRQNMLDAMSRGLKNGESPVVTCLLPTGEYHDMTVHSMDLTHSTDPNKQTVTFRNPWHNYDKTMSVADFMSIAYQVTK